ncbi:MAG: hypothetical protein RLZZ112_828 [Verrucomicrobiota bacterium]
METRILPADETGIALAARLLREGAVAAFPTETVYGLGGRADRVESIHAIFAAKGRPSTDPLILHLPEPDLAKAAEGGWVADPLPQTAIILAKAFWPGPLTLILRRGAKVHAEMTAGLDTVAVRCPSHPIAQKLLRAVGSPLAAPSANRFGRISPTDADAVRQELGGKIPLILDGGPCSVGLESTVVNLVGPNPEILRPGAVTVEQITELLGQKPLVRHAAVQKEKAQISPGQLASHYAPRTPLYLCETPIRHFTPGFFHILFRDKPESLPSSTLALGTDGKLESAARDLYRTLRTADSSGAETILVEPVPDGPWSEAIRDRLHRASSGTARWNGKSWEMKTCRPL